MMQTDYYVPKMIGDIGNIGNNSNADFCFRLFPIRASATGSATHKMSEIAWFFVACFQCFPFSLYRY